MTNLHEFFFDNWNFAQDNVFECPSEDYISVFPPTEGNFLLSTGDDFLLSDGSNFELS